MQPMDIPAFEELFERKAHVPEHPGTCPLKEGIFMRSPRDKPGEKTYEEV